MKNRHIIDVWNNYKYSLFHIECFNRSLIIVFSKDFNEYSEEFVNEQLENSYYEWIDDSKDTCCEEYLINSLPENYKNNIVCVIYDDKEVI